MSAPASLPQACAHCLASAAHDSSPRWGGLRDCHWHIARQVRVAAVQSVRALVPCGASDAALPLTAFQDPHYVPVRAFYGPCTRVNYCARLAVDNSIQARAVCCAVAQFQQQGVCASQVGMQPRSC